MARQAAQTLTQNTQDLNGTVTPKTTPAPQPTLKTLEKTTPTSLLTHRTVKPTVSTPSPTSRMTEQTTSTPPPSFETTEQLPTCPDLFLEYDDTLKTTTEDAQIVLTATSPLYTTTASLTPSTVAMSQSATDKHPVVSLASSVPTTAPPHVTTTEKSVTNQVSTVSTAAPLQRLISTINTSVIGLVPTVERVSNFSATNQTVSSLELDHNDIDVLDSCSAAQLHVMRKREAKWKAYGFDASVLNIADPWAGRNLWNN